MKEIALEQCVNRIIDANINRAKEGLRVCEEITRFIIEDRTLTSNLKNIRHKISELSDKIAPKSIMLKERNARKDIGKNIYASELKRKNILDILFANLQRSKESIRALEEFSKLLSSNTALGFKELRYKLYELEKNIIIKISRI